MDLIIMRRSLGILISLALLLIVFLHGCSLFPRKTFDRKLGNNPEAAMCAKVWQDKGTKEGVPQKWHIEIQPAKGGELGGRALEQYRKKVKDVKITVTLTGKAVSKWKKVIEQKKNMSNPYLAWPDGWLETTVKELVAKDEKKRRDQNLQYAYPNADVTLTLIVNGKVGAIARYNASTKSTSLEIHY